MSALRSVEAQWDDVRAALRLLPAHLVPVADALGATLREQARAVLDIPAFDNSAMDGFAVRFADVADARPDHEAGLTVIGDVPAGSPLDPAVGAGEAVRIMTGAPLPTAADTVVPFEDTASGLHDSLVRTRVTRAPAVIGAHVRRRGEDLTAGAEVLPAGVRLGPLQLSAAAAAGVETLAVSRRPQVAVVSTGSELVPAGLPLRRGQIPESNGVLLGGLAAGAGAEVLARLTVDDEGPGLREAVRTMQELGVDVIVCSGGVSAGAFEVVRTEFAGTMAFTKVAMQPGKPQGFGTLDDGTLLFGLPGNPVSAAVSFEVFVRPALLAMQGRTEVQRPRLTLPAAVGWRAPRGRRQYLPAVVELASDGLAAVRPATVGGSGSHLAGGLGRAHALAIVPEETDAVTEGDPVEVMLWEGWGT